MTVGKDALLACVVDNLKSYRVSLSEKAYTLKCIEKYEMDYITSKSICFTRLHDYSMKIYKLMDESMPEEGVYCARGCWEKLFIDFLYLMQMNSSMLKYTPFTTDWINTLLFAFIYYLTEKKKINNKNLLSASISIDRSTRAVLLLCHSRPNSIYVLLHFLYISVECFCHNIPMNFLGFPFIYAFAVHTIYTTAAQWLLL